MSAFSNWKSDNYKFVGKAFDFAYADRLNKLSPVFSEVNSSSVDYELTGTGGYGEAPAYDGSNLNEGRIRRGFKTVITPVEYTISHGIKCAMSMTKYGGHMHIQRHFFIKKFV